METTIFKAEVLVVGGGTGGTAAALQAARRGAQTILVSEFPWLGGMLTTAGVAAPDGNELLAFQTGIWGAFLTELQRRQPGGLDHAWVSFFTYEPKIGAAIFADWARELPNLQWIANQVPREVIRQGDRVLGVRFNELTVHAQITLDGTELGDLLALGGIPYRWGWEEQSQFAEPSTPRKLTAPEEPLYPIVQTYPVQAPTWVVLLRDAGVGNDMPKIMPTEDYQPDLFQGAWEGYEPAEFLGYGKLPQQQFMINWPQQGNDYGVNLERLVRGEASWQEWAQEAIAHSTNFAHYIQSQLGQRYGLAADAFPQLPGRLGGGALALMPYYRESRRLVGLATVTEHHILPQRGKLTAALPRNEENEVSAIALGNYPNDHHYPGFEMPLAPKSMRWGGRWTGTPFTIPYEALIPARVDGLLVCDKNISVSHIANGATRLQPVVLGIGQAAGMAAALCIEQNCEPRDLSVRSLQLALLDDPTAPAAVVPLIDNLPKADNWRSRQVNVLERRKISFKDNQAISFPQKGRTLTTEIVPSTSNFQGIFKFTKTGKNWEAKFKVSDNRTLQLVTLHPAVHNFFSKLKAPVYIAFQGYANWTAGWLQVTGITSVDVDSGFLRR